MHVTHANRKVGSLISSCIFTSMDPWQNQDHSDFLKKKKKKKKNITQAYQKYGKMTMVYFGPHPWLVSLEDFREPGGSTKTFLGVKQSTPEMY